MPIYWSDRPEGALLGYLDNKTEIAWFSHDKRAEQITGKALDNMQIIVRELKGGPPTCGCAEVGYHFDLILLSLTIALVFSARSSPSLQ